MKINDKNLAAFASSSSQIDREGYLMKRGEAATTTTTPTPSTPSSTPSSTKFIRRYFILKGNLLFYFDKKSDKEPLGVIILEGSTVELADSECEQHFCFKVTFPSKSYTLGAESQGGMEAWMKSLACASYDYVKLMADELQRQLDELCKNEGEGSSAGSGDSPGRGSPIPTPPPRARSSKMGVAGGKGQGQHQPVGGHGGGRTQVSRRSFTSLHEEYGVKILLDQEARWAGEVEGGGVGPRSSIPLSVGVGGQNDLMNF